MSQQKEDTWRDPIIEAYKKDIDRTLIRENLKLNQRQRIEQFEDFMSFIDGMREMGRTLQKGKA